MPRSNRVQHSVHEKNLFQAFLTKNENKTMASLLHLILLFSFRRRRSLDIARDPLPVRLLPVHQLPVTCALALRCGPDARRLRLDTDGGSVQGRFQGRADSATAEGDRSFVFEMSMEMF